MQKKIISEIKRVYTSLPPTDIVLMDDKEVISIKSADYSVIVYLMDGVGMIFNDDNVFGYVQAPFFFGLQNLNSYSPSIDNSLRDLNFESVNGCVIKIYKPNDFILAVDRENLWKDVSMIVSHQLSILMHLMETVRAKNSYLIIRKQLLHISEYKNIFCEYNVCDLITRRTGLSKSHVMQILSVLNKHGFIKIKRGRLIDVINLPLSL